MKNGSLIAFMTSAGLMAAPQYGSAKDTHGAAHDKGRATIAPISTELQGVYDTLRRITLDGASAEEIGKFMYWPEAMVDGEGLEKAFHSLAEYQPAMAELLAVMGKDCEATFRDPVVTSGALAAVYGQVNCRYKESGKPDLVAHALWIWERRGKEWKIIREAYLNGPLR